MANRVAIKKSTAKVRGRLFEKDESVIPELRLSGLKLQILLWPDFYGFSPKNEIVYSSRKGSQMLLTDTFTILIIYDRSEQLMDSR